MKSKVFLMERLKSLATQSDFVEFKYGYDTLSETHFISVRPSNLMIEEESFILLRYELLEDFYTQYPAESVVFLPVEDSDEFDNYEEVIRNEAFFEDYFSWLSVPLVVNGEVELSNTSQTTPINDSDYALAA